MLLLFLELLHSFENIVLNTHPAYVTCVLDQVSGGAWQYGGWPAESCIQVTGPVCPAHWAHAAFLVSVLLQPAGYAHHPAAGVTCRNQPQKVCVSNYYSPLLMFENDLPLVWNLDLHWSHLLFAWRFTTTGLKTLCVTLAGRQSGELVCQHWASFHACFEWFCNWCRLKIWMRKSCPSSDRFCQCCCSMYRFTASCWPTPLYCKRSYNTSR